MNGNESTMNGYLKGDPSIQLAKTIIIENFYGFTHAQIVEKIRAAKAGETEYKSFLGAVLIEKVMEAYKEDAEQAMIRVLYDTKSIEPVIWGWGELDK